MDSSFCRTAQCVDDRLDTDNEGGVYESVIAGLKFRHGVIRFYMTSERHMYEWMYGVTELNVRVMDWDENWCDVSPENIDWIHRYGVFMNEDYCQDWILWKTK